MRNKFCCIIIISLFIFLIVDYYYIISIHKKLSCKYIKWSLYVSGQCNQNHEDHYKEDMKNMRWKKKKKSIETIDDRVKERKTKKKSYRDVKDACESTSQWRYPIKMVPLCDWIRRNYPPSSPFLLSVEYLPDACMGRVHSTWVEINSLCVQIAASN